MAGPLIRVDTDGRGTLLKMTAGEAAKYVASHAGASIWGAKPVAAEPDTAQFVEPAAQPEFDIARMKKAQLVAIAMSRGIDASGTAAELRDRLAEPVEDSEDEQSDEDNDEDDSDQE